MISALFSRLIILFFGTLYPAYASYKAVRTKNVKEYVKWMMYWIVFAFFTCIETFTDIFLSWFPFYYEVKVVIVLWLLSPATKGSSTLYRKFVHPMLTRREQEIDEYLNQAKERGYSAVLQLGSKGVNYATNVIMQTAIKGGGNLVQTIKRSYSLSDLSEPDMHRTQDELDDVMMSSSAVVMRPHASTSSSTRLLRPRNQTPVGRSASGTRHSTGMYFTEVDVTAKNAGDYNYNIRSQDDISSGYSSAEPLSGLSRTSSMTNASKARLKSKRNEDKSMSASCTTLPRTSSRKTDKTQVSTNNNPGQTKTRNKSEK
ncbi:receptor expression-enhancing protein 1 isoform X3 [Drosophila tropicalis]|uniref:receptor expression-enhancing protein 1 isoform X3 n=1 Tax=Drosophila tropicalis TaxID=46794 RepID=UPI0035ABFC26